MRLTTKSQYGLKVLGILVRNYREHQNGYIQIGTLASECGTSQKYLEQVMAILARGGVLESKRGQHGGYRLARPPQRISLAEVLRTLEGLLLPIPQWADDNIDGLALGIVLRRVRDSIRSILEETTIEVLTEGTGSDIEQTDVAVKELMYYI